MPVRLDPTPLTAAGELEAIASGRCTYTVARRASLLEVANRAPWDITGRPPPPHPDAQPRADVVTDHACGWTWQPEHVNRSRLEGP